jgi:hypothetical protein
MQFRLTGIAVALLTAIVGLAPAAAQRIPPGSYQNSCTNVGVWGADTLVATCRTRAGSALRTGLPNVYRCVGDIGNNNGVLQCTRPGGRQTRGYAMGGPPPGPAPYAAPPPPGYGRGEEARERCRRLHHREEELRYERDRTFNPGERERIEHEVHEVRERLRQCY